MFRNKLWLGLLIGWALAVFVSPRDVVGYFKKS